MLFLLIWVVNVLSPVRGLLSPNRSLLSPGRGLGNQNQSVRRMRKIDLIVIHCTATREDERLSEELLDEYHRILGYDGCGYHYYIRRDGNVVSMRPVERIGAHARGHNAHSIGIAYEGGLNSAGEPADTRTIWQRNSLHLLVDSLLREYPGSSVVGHRDLSPDLDGDGEISPAEWVKSCPCFDVRTAL